MGKLKPLAKVLKVGTKQLDEAGEMAARGAAHSEVSLLEDAKLVLNNEDELRGIEAGEPVVEEVVAPPRVDLQQLRDPEFSRKAVEQDSPMSNLTNPNDEGLSIESRYERWAKDNEPIEEFFRSNPRAMAIVKDFVGEDSLSAKFLADSGAEDMPLFGWHTDVATDPRSIDEGFIQTTTKANELGLHLGSKAASTDMFSPTVKKRLERDFSSLSAIFDELGDFNPEVPQIFEEAFETVRSNKHLRPGESFKDTQVPEFRALIDELFEEIAVAADSYRTGDNMELMNDLANLGNSDMMAGRIERWMKGTYDPTTVPVVVKGKNPLYVPDLEANTARRHALHQLNFGEDTLDESTLKAVVQAWDAGEYDEANALFKKALTDKGFDPVLAYHNGAEDKGVLSFIVMDDSYVMPLWGRGSSVNPMMARRMQMEYLMAPLAAMLGIGGKDATLRETK